MKIKFKCAVDSIDDLEKSLRASFTSCFEVCEGNIADDCDEWHDGLCAACHPIEIIIEIKKVGRTKKSNGRSKS